MLRSTLSRAYNALAPSHDPYAPHSDVNMEGYYTHLHTPPLQGASSTLIVIFCQVATASDKLKRVMVYTLYMPRHDPDTLSTGSGFIREMYAPEWVLAVIHSHANSVAAWTLTVPGLGEMRVAPHEQSLYVVLNSTRALRVSLRSRVPWDSSSPISGPEGPLERLGTWMPLHWHVFSTASDATWAVIRLEPSRFPASADAAARIPALHVLEGVERSAIGHMEKNHGVSFPSGWFWAHGVSLKADADGHDARSSVRLAMAGGRTMGVDAMFLGFRDDARGIEWDFGPPLCVGRAGRGTGMQIKRSWQERRLHVNVWDLGRWVDVQIVAPKDSFVFLPGPLAEGFACDLCCESFQATFIIVLRERPSALAAWREVSRHIIEEGAMEFGGSYGGEETQ